MKKTIAKIVIATTLLSPLAMAMPAWAATPNWDVSGTYVANFNYLGNDYAHDITLTQDNAGNLTGNGGSPSGANTYTWTITSGTVSDDAIDFYADYTATPDAVGTTMHVVGTIDQDGNMSGTWTDNYQGGERSGTWETTSGTAQPLSEFVTVTIVKYVDGAMATAQSGQSMDFEMNATWNADNIGAGTGSFNLSPSGFNGDPTPYQAVTSPMTSGASYSVNETMDGDPVGEACGTGSPYALEGYSTGDTLESASQAPVSLTPPALTNITTNQYIIVHNLNCDNEDNGEIGGDVEQGNGVLHVDSIDMVDSSGTADNNWEHGWVYMFNITVPQNEPNVAMKFADWMSGANTLPVANNMRISSLQANNGNATVLLTAANTYSTPPLTMTGDLDAGLAGKQVQIKVEVKIPVGTANGSYTTTYGVQSNP